MKLFYFRSVKSGLVKYAVAAVNGNEAKQLITDRLAETGVNDPEWPNKVSSHSANVGEVVFVQPLLSPNDPAEEPAVTPEPASTPAVTETSGISKSAKKAG